MGLLSKARINELGSVPTLNVLLITRSFLLQFGYVLGGLSLLLNVWQWEWNIETTVIMYGILHGLGGASVLVNLGMMSYMSDVSTRETKVRNLHRTTKKLDLSVQCKSKKMSYSSAQQGAVNGGETQHRKAWDGPLGLRRPWPQPPVNYHLFYLICFVFLF